MDISLTWKAVWQSHVYRLRLILGFIIALSLVAFMPVFFPYIEHRTNGSTLNDRFLDWLPARDVSVPIFLCIWITTIFTLSRVVKNPVMLVIGLYGFAVLTITRMLTIFFIPLNPPLGLIPLVDPLSNFFYGKVSFVTRDLFFSGHVSSQFLYFLTLKKRGDKMVCLTSTIVVAVLVLVQHVHYTIDVIAAIPMTFFCAKLGEIIALAGWGPNKGKLEF